MNSAEASNVPLILVLLAVYNGEKFLQQQMDSILAQSHQNLRLICRDDGSTDRSVQLLQTLVSSYPEKILVLQDNKGNLGAAGSFSELMRWAAEHCNDQHNVYFAFADQDDTWHPDKLTLCLDAMLNAESISPDASVLVHSDLRVVDTDGRELSGSFIEYQGLRPGKTSLPAQLVSNTLTGCTSLMNKKLLKKSLPVPPAAVMHDWWVSVVASAFGRRVFLPERLVDYRQHGANTLGARRAETHGIDVNTLRRVIRTRDTDARDQIFKAMAEQAECFLERFGTETSPLQRFIIRQVIALRDAGVWRRRLLYRLMARL